MATPKDSFGADAITTIGPSILISGKLTGDEDLTVLGRVEGELNLTKTLMIETTGIVKANVSVKNAIVSGVVVGNIAASESVELTKDGRMVGDIHAPRVIIVDGASFRGRVDMGNAEPRPATDRAATRRPTMATAPARTNPVPVAARLPTPVARPAQQAPVARPAQQAPVARPAQQAKPLPPPPPAPVVASIGAKRKVILKKK